MLPSEQLAQQFLTRHPEVAVDILASLLPSEQAQALANLEISAAVGLLLKMPPVDVARTLQHAESATAIALLSAMPARNVADILRRVALPERDRYLAALPVRTARIVRAAIERTLDSVAVLMDRQALSFPLENTIEQVLQRLEREPDDAGHHLYITDNAGRFVGVLSLRQVFASHPRLRIGSLPLKAMTALPEGARSSSVLSHPAWLRHPHLPVIDAGGRFVGVLRRERLVERSADARQAPGNLLGTVMALMEGYATANAVLLELLMQGPDKRR